VTDAPVGETFEQRKARIAAVRRINAVLPKEKRNPIPPLHGPETTQKRDSPGGDPVEQMMTMTRSDYFQYVCANLSADKDHLWDQFLDPRIVHLTHQALARKRALVVRLKMSPETDVGRRRRNFLDMVENRMQQVQEALPTLVLTSGETSVRRLFAAIQAHRRALATNRVEPEPWDLALWKVADDLIEEADG
jgi:hypothetical protein